MRRSLMSTLRRPSVSQRRLIALDMTLALLAAVGYLLIAMGLLGVGDLQTENAPATIVYVAGGGYLLGGLLIFARRRWLWIAGTVVNTLVLMTFTAAYLHRSSVMFSPGGIATKIPQILLEVGLLYLIATSRSVTGLRSKTAAPGER